MNTYKLLASKKLTAVLIIVLLPLIAFSVLQINAFFSLKPPSSGLTQVVVTSNPAKVEMVLMTSDLLDSYKVGSTAQINIAIDTGSSKVAAIDSIVNFPIDMVQITKVTPGTSFDDYPSFTAKDGKVYLSGVKNANSTVQGKLTLGSFEVKFLKTGTAAFTLQYQPRSTIDSNIVDINGQDLLNNVTNTQLNIK